MAKKTQAVAAGRRSYRRGEDARRALAERARTEISLPTYARLAGIPLARLRRWQERLSSPASPACREVHAGPVAEPEESTVATSVFAGEVIVGTYVVRVPLGFDDGEVRRLLLTVGAC